MASQVSLILSRMFLAAKAFPSRIINFSSKMYRKATEKMFSTTVASHYRMSVCSYSWLTEEYFFILKGTRMSSSLVSSLLANW